MANEILGAVDVPRAETKSVAQTCAPAAAMDGQQAEVDSAAVPRRSLSVGEGNGGHG